MPTRHLFLFQFGVMRKEGTETLPDRWHSQLNSLPLPIKSFETTLVFPLYVTVALQSDAVHGNCFVTTCSWQWPPASAQRGETCDTWSHWQPPRHSLCDCPGKRRREKEKKKKGDKAAACIRSRSSHTIRHSNLSLCQMSTRLMPFANPTLIGNNLKIYIGGFELMLFSELTI